MYIKPVWTLIEEEAITSVKTPPRNEKLPTIYNNEFVIQLSKKRKMCVQRDSNDDAKAEDMVLKETLKERKGEE